MCKTTIEIARICKTTGDVVVRLGIMPWPYAFMAACSSCLLLACVFLLFSLQHCFRPIQFSRVRFNVVVARRVVASISAATIGNLRCWGSATVEFGRERCWRGAASCIALQAAAAASAADAPAPSGDATAPDWWWYSGASGAFEASRHAVFTSASTTAAAKARQQLTL